MIVWGKKHVFDMVGYVADFCPICRDVRRFMMQEILLAGHVYGLTVGDFEKP